MLDVSGLIPRAYDLKCPRRGSTASSGRTASSRWAVGTDVRCWVRRARGWAHGVRGQARQAAAPSGWPSRRRTGDRRRFRGALVTKARLEAAAFRRK